MTELSALFRRAAEGFGSHAHSIGADQWHNPTPCTDWDVRMLVNHVTVEHLQETGLFAPPVPVPDDAPLQTKLLALFGRRV